VTEKAKGQEGIKISDVNSVVPQSAELKEFLEQQKSIRRRLETLESKSYT
jgi:ubiquinone biosynthesis protein UbiJ